MSNRKKKKVPTINDIALKLGVSAATVSRALNDHDDISENTKKRVREMAEKLGYHRNQIASGLRQRKSNTIGVIVPQLVALFHSTIITVIQNKLHDHGYNVLLCQSNDSYELEKEMAETLFSYRVDGIIAAITLFTENYDHFRPFIDLDIPVLFYDRVPVADFPAHFVVSDDFRGGYLAGAHLRDVGVQRPAFICGPLSCNLYLDRDAGFRHAMQQTGLSLDEDFIFYQELTHDNAWEVCRKIFQRKNPPDGIFTANDTSALAVLQFAKENGIISPDDLKIIGYSNDPRSAIVEPAITTIDQNIPMMADAVVTRMLALMDEDQTVMEKTGKEHAEIIGVSLVRRMTT